MLGGKKIFYILTLAILAIALSGCTVKIGPDSQKKVADGGVWRSIDGGKEWKQKEAVLTTSGKKASIQHVNVRRMAFDPQDYKTIYLATEASGIIYSYDNGDSWQQIEEFKENRIRDVDVDPKDKCNIFALNGNKIFKSSDCGREWKTVYFHQDSSVLLTDMVIDHYNNKNIFVVNNAGEIIKSTNNGNTWFNSHRVKGGKFVDIVMNPKDSRIIYAATTKKGIFKTTNGGATWTSLGEGLKSYSGSHEYKAFLIDPTEPNNIFLISKFGMLKSADAGASWDIVDLLPAPKATTIYSAGIDPKDGNTLYYTTRTTLLKSTDGGSTWSSKQLPFARVANRILINPENTDIIYLGAFKIKDK